MHAAACSIADVSQLFRELMPQYSHCTAEMQLLLSMLETASQMYTVYISDHQHVAHVKCCDHVLF